MSGRVRFLFSPRVTSVLLNGRRALLSKLLVVRTWIVLASGRVLFPRGQLMILLIVVIWRWLLVFMVVLLFRRRSLTSLFVLI